MFLKIQMPVINIKTGRADFGEDKKEEIYLPERARSV